MIMKINLDICLNVCYYGYIFNRGNPIIKIGGNNMKNWQIELYWYSGETTKLTYKASRHAAIQTIQLAVLAMFPVDLHNRMIVNVY